MDRLARSYPSGPDGEMEGVEAFHLPIIFTAQPHPHPLPNAASPTTLGAPMPSQYPVPPPPQLLHANELGLLPPSPSQPPPSPTQCLLQCPCLAQLPHADPATQPLYGLLHAP